MSEESTTPDLVELERLGWAALNRGDVGVYLRPDVILDTAAYGMGTFDGRAAAIGFVKEWISCFDDLTITPDEILDLGNGVVLAVYHQEGRPMGSTNYVRVRSAIVSVWEDRAVVQMTIYPDHEIDEARAAAERLAEERV